MEQAKRESDAMIVDKLIEGIKSQPFQETLLNIVSQNQMMMHDESADSQNMTMTASNDAIRQITRPALNQESHTDNLDTSDLEGDSQAELNGTVESLIKELHLESVKQERLPSGRKPKNELTRTSKHESLIISYIHRREEAHIKEIDGLKGKQKDMETCLHRL